MMEAADEASGRHLLGDEADAVVGVIRRRGVVEREKRAGQDLNREEREEDAAEREEPPGTRRQRFVEHDAPPAAESDPRVEPVEEAPHSFTRTLPPRTCAATLSSGRGGGPDTTRPLTSYTPP